jgi:hypothetical protein
MSDGKEVTQKKANVHYYGKGNENHELGTGFFIRKKVILAFKRVEFVSDKMLYKILRGL